MQTIHTDILIDAPPQRVWALLTNWDGHPTWDPFFASIEGEAQAGSRLTVRFRKGFTMRPRVTELAPGHVLEWHGRLGVPGLFDGRHRFEVRGEASGTRFVHSERFSGILVAFTKKLLRETAQGFTAFNEALKHEAERDGAQSRIDR